MRPHWGLLGFKGLTWDKFRVNLNKFRFVAKISWLEWWLAICCWWWCWQLPGLMYMKSFSQTFLLFLSDVLGKKMKVISTDPGASLPAKEGRAELVNSSLVKYSEVTICARFLTHHFSTHPDGGPYQTLISYGRDDLLNFKSVKSDLQWIYSNKDYQEISLANRTTFIFT